MTTLAELTARTAGLPCRLAPDTWYSDNARDRSAAVRACRNCPLMEACAEYAIDAREAEGVWGGTTPADRRGFWSGRRHRFDGEGRLRLVCGSLSAYYAHFSYREQPCVECQAAHDAQVDADRRARLAAEHAKGGSTTGYHLHRRIGEPACEACLGATRAASAAARRRKASRGRGRARALSVAPASAESLPGAPAGVQPLAIAV
jgi:hypothetical protein